MEKLLSSGPYHLFVDIANTNLQDQFNVVFSTTFDGAKNPNEHRRAFSHILNKSEIKSLIEILESSIRDENTQTNN